MRSYDLGVNSFITKPVTFEGLVEVMKAFGRYWIDIVELPSDIDLKQGHHERAADLAVQYSARRG